ncbi:MAG: arylesterase [Sphingomonas bacterium]|uniref:arylesterase n=1 Tax=Sphingomonas bacterium TaxID=1895847 RepID=UPI00260671B2|nr:arylesterase [Sphingomonas bacterium]MDB5694691.1 arylesterase [Sphingomonas bacterium]
MTFPHILALGDSLTAGYGLAPHESFPRQLEVLLRRRYASASVVNAGVSGDTSAGGRARLARVLAALTARPELAIVALGANDLLRGIAPERMRENLDAILTELARCDIPVLLAGMWAPPFLGAFAERYNGVFPALAKAHGVPLYPFFLAGVAGVAELTLRDRIHPNAQAIGIVATRILPQVEAALAGAQRRAA